MRFFNLFKRKEQPPTYWAIKLMELEEEKKQYPEMQRREDARLEAAAKTEARDMFRQHLAGHLILIPKRQFFTITVYPDQESKYDSDGYNKLVKSEYQKLLAETSPQKNEF